MVLSIYDRFITRTDSGATIGGASVTVTVPGTGALAQLYEDRDGEDNAANPFTADSDGRVQFYLAPGRYNISATGGGVTINYPDVLVGLEFVDGVQSVETIDDLRNLTGLTNGQSIYVRGYVGSLRGGGMFTSSDNIVDTDNGVTRFVTTDGVRVYRDSKDLTPLDAGASGDGTTNDDAEFAVFESVVSGRDIDLRGLTYKVTTIPTLNSYYNGKWALPDRTVMARFDDTISFPGVRCTKFGGQLAQLKNSLCDPFEQFTGIAFLGDSITWGATLPENLSPGSDLTTLATRRDVFASPSFVNEFKRWVGRNYFDDATPVITNWAASSAGEAIATYSKTEQVYTNREPFTWTPTGTSTVTDTAAASAITGYQAVYAVGAGSGNEALIEFPFTGQELTVVFTCVDSDAVDYELIVDGVSQGLFGTSSADGYTNMAFNQRSDHTFGYVRNKTVGIKIVGDGAPSIRRLRIEGIEIPKTVRITNQGISGSNSTRYRSRALTTDFLPDIAVAPEDNFSFLMLGTNDRLDPTWPQGINSFQEQMEDILNILDPLCETIVMCANAVGASNQAGKKFTMQQIRSVLYKMSNIRQHDFIDNYAIFDNADTTRYLADALHPNVLGHYMIYRNIVDALES